MSRKTTGAPSTKPPAVIGREWESLVGAWMPPVDMPEGRGSGFCGLSGVDCEDCRLKAIPENSTTQNKINARKKTTEGRRDPQGAVNVGCPPTLDHPDGGFDLR